MFQNSYFLTVMIAVLLPAIASANLQNEANQHYQNSEWKQAAKAYAKLAAEQPENQQALYRLAHAHIELRQGKDALQVLEKLPEQNQIPPFMLHYRKAQAYLLMGDKEKMSEQLDQAANSGFSLLNNLKEPIWDSVRDTEQFTAFSTAVDKNARPCMHNPKNGLFDFWLGHWAVYGNLEKQGPLFGNNHIEKIEGGCLMMEHWTGASGSTGTSMNYYDGTLDQWVQHWVSAGGTTINMFGGIEDGSMVLTGKIYYARIPQGPQIRDFRGTWTLQENGAVRQFFEESVDGGKTWYTWFEGFYFKEKAE